MGPIGIVAFPNFAHWTNRLHVMTGCEPVTRAWHCEWYDAPDTSVGTYADLDVLASMGGLRVTDSFGLQAGQVVLLWPDLSAKVAVFNFQSEAWRARP